MMRFKTCMRRDTNVVNEMNPNYGIVGFRSIMVTKMAPLMLLGVWASTSLGIGSTIHLVISLALWMVWSWLWAMNGGDNLVDRGKSTLGFSNIMFFILFSYSAFILLIHCSFDGCRWHGQWGETCLKYLQLVHGYYQMVPDKPLRQVLTCHLSALWKDWVSPHFWDAVYIVGFRFSVGLVLTYLSF